MSIKYGLLALLRNRPGYGYQLRVDFESATGSTWPVNVGQIYTTLARLERDELVAKTGADAEGHVLYEITELGRSEIDEWFLSPAVAPTRPRDEVVVKLALAVTVPGVDVAEIMLTQRRHTHSRLQELARQQELAKLKRGPGPQHLLALSLVLEAQILQAEAEIRWLDHVEASVGLVREPGRDSTHAQLRTRLPAR